MHTRSIIEFANVSYSYNFYRNDEYTRLVQTSAQTQDKNAAISGNAQLATSAKREVPRATCNEREVPRATCNKRGARSSPCDLQRARSAKFPARLATSAEREVPRAEIASVSHHTARRKRRTVCPHKELQSAFIPFMTSERMSCKSLRTDKRKTLRRCLSPDFSRQRYSGRRFLSYLLLYALHGNDNQTAFGQHTFIGSRYIRIRNQNIRGFYIADETQSGCSGLGRIDGDDNVFRILNH